MCAKDAYINSCEFSGIVRKLVMFKGSHLFSLSKHRCHLQGGKIPVNNNP